MDLDKIKKSLSVIRNTQVTRHTSNQRWYKIRSSDWKPSVTTVIGGAIAKGIGFEKWLGNHPSYDIACEFRDKAARRGTFVHESAEKYLKGETVVVPEDIESREEICKHLMSFEKWANDYKGSRTGLGYINILEQEVFLIDKDMPWAGTPDIIGHFGEKLIIIDLKTGDPHKSHEIQLNMYAMLLEKLCDLDEHTVDIYGLYTKGKWIKAPSYSMKKYKRDSNIPLMVADIWAYLNYRTKPYPKDMVKLDDKFKLGGTYNEL